MKKVYLFIRGFMLIFILVHFNISVFSQNVGIGITSPTSRLFVNGNPASTSTVLFATNNYVGNFPVFAIEGYSVPNPGFGTGVSGIGGHTGISGSAYSDTYSGISYGVTGYATGSSGTHIGIYGTASGGTTNWAGFFAGNGHFAGNLGIGNSVPGEKLTVSIPDNNNATNIAAFYSNDGSQGIGIGFDEIRKIGVNPNSNLTLNAKGIGNLILQNTATGNVGIGTTSPPSLLSLQSNNTGQTAIEIVNTSAGGIPYRLQSVGSGTAGRIGNFEIRRSDVGKSLLTIQPGGNIGIGTTSPLARLNVNGDTTSTNTILYAQNNYVGNASITAINAHSVPNPGYGTGVFGTGGSVGIKGFANSTTFAGTAYGIYGSTSGSGTGTRIGVFGSALGGSTNWAGFFEGNSYFSENVAIGIAVPSVRLYVNGDASSNASVIYSKNNYTGSQNVSAVEGHSAASIGYGVGVSGTGGLVGVNGLASATTFPGTAYGIYGAATGSAGTRIGVYGFATGGTVANWAGYFVGQSYFSGNIGITTASPNSALHIHDPLNLGPQITLSAPGGGTPGIAFRPYQGSADWVTAPQALITATDNNWSANINFSTKIQGAIGNPLVQRMIIQNDGNVGIGIINPGDKLVVFNGTTTGTYTSSGWMHSSDSRLKTNIRPLESCLAKIMKLQGVSYDWKANPNDNNQIGFIAQDVEKVFPEVISKDLEGNYSMAPHSLTAPIIEAIKEQQQQMHSMEITIKKLETMIENIQLTIASLQNENSQLNSKQL